MFHKGWDIWVTVAEAQGASFVSFYLALHKICWTGVLTGSVGRACDSWFQGCELAPHVGCGAYVLLLIFIYYYYLFLNK